ncbi:unnamed protein product [Cladocopium goreaui]|uniref:Uncharacterized protein n=1 Tax=Cladocopium goreaui TaxID=2562237 RepID=A0A9P1C1P3_9DINO|nr:unnamed protein product [Cladocopium goreaui]
MVSWKRQCGNKGYVLMEQFRNLLRLILAKGFETNSEIAGVELPVCSVHNPKLIDGITVWMQPIEDSLPANSISMIKGWDGFPPFVGRRAYDFVHLAVKPRRGLIRDRSMCPGPPMLFPTLVLRALGIVVLFVNFESHQFCKTFLDALHKPSNRKKLLTYGIRSVGQALIQGRGANLRAILAKRGQAGLADADAPLVFNGGELASLADVVAREAPDAPYESVERMIAPPTPADFLSHPSYRCDQPDICGICESQEGDSTSAESASDRARPLGYQWQWRLFSYWLFGHLAPMAGRTSKRFGRADPADAAAAVLDAPGLGGLDNPWYPPCGDALRFFATSETWTFLDQWWFSPFF